VILYRHRFNFCNKELCFFFLFNIIYPNKQLIYIRALYLRIKFYQQLALTLKAANEIANPFNNGIYLNLVEDTTFSAKDPYDACH